MKNSKFILSKVCQKIFSPISLIVKLMLPLSCGDIQDACISMKYLSDLLTNIEDSPAIKERSTYITCCSFDALADKMFFCQKCSSTSLYVFEPYNDDTKSRIDQYSDVLYEKRFDYQLKCLNDIVSDKGILMEIDKTAFCFNCNPSGRRKFYLKIYYPNEMSHISELNEPCELIKLIAFFSGEKIWLDYTYRVRPLKTQIQLIKELLGLSNGIKETRKEARSPRMKNMESNYNIEDILVKNNGRKLKLIQQADDGCYLIKVFHKNKTSYFIIIGNEMPKNIESIISEGIEYDDFFKMTMELSQFPSKVISNLAYVYESKKWPYNSQYKVVPLLVKEKEHLDELIEIVRGRNTTNSN